MTAAKRLTDLMIDRVRLPSGGRQTLWDVGEAGLGVRIGAKRKAFVLKMRHDGQQQMLNLGRHPAMTIAEARAAARKLKELSARGIRPGQKPVEDDIRRRAKSGRVADIVEIYITDYAKPNQRSWKDTAGLLRNHLAKELGSKPVTAVTKGDVLRLLDAVRSRGMAQGANRLLAHTKRFFGWCVERGLIELSPAAGIRPPLKERARDRVLTEHETARVWQAACTVGFPFGPAVQLLLLTGQRRDEVSHMRWRELDLDNGSWTIPAERNKGGRLHVVPLSALALSILRSVPRSEDYVFWGRSPATAINGWSRTKERLDQLSEVTDWRLHDLRRTAATGMARLGFDPHVVERVLNHATSTAGPLARVYQRYAYEDEKRAALDSWSAQVTRLCAPAEPQVEQPSLTPPAQTRG